MQFHEVSYQILHFKNRPTLTSTARKFSIQSWYHWLLNVYIFSTSLRLCSNTTWEYSNTKETRMWAYAQRYGRPAKYRWRPLFNAAKFGWRPLLECRAVTLPRHETRWNLQGCPKLANRSQPLVGRSSPYYEDMWRRYRCLTSFFSDCLFTP